MIMRCSKVIVTGGSSGIGFAIAKELLDNNVSVTITGRNERKLEEAKQKLDHDKLHTLVWDVTESENRIKNIHTASDMMGGLDGLVNCAGIGSISGMWENWNMTEEIWDETLDINLKAAFFLMRDVVDFMYANKTKGNVLNISSCGATGGVVSAYHVAKLALMRLTRSYGKLWAGRGIIINCIAPGPTWTPMYERHGICYNDGKSDATTLGRLIEPEEIGKLAAYMLSKSGEIIVGDTIVADAGDHWAYD